MGVGDLKLGILESLLALNFHLYILFIKKIVLSNTYIKVWNISLGSNQEINNNFILAEASAFDKIQYENNVIFVLVGTDKPNEDVVK